MRTGARIRTNRAARTAKRGAAVAAAALVLTLSACGGRKAEPLPLQTALDPQFDCVQLAAQRAFLVRRIADLEDERDFNRARTLSRVPGALIGSPISAILLADPSIAIYREIDAAEARDDELERLQEARGCLVQAPGAPAEEAEDPGPPPFDTSQYDQLVAAAQSKTEQTEDVESEPTDDAESENAPTE